jgi:putative hydrolase of the HAD superfamily
MGYKKVVFWDFDETLTYREWKWSGTLAQVARDADPPIDLAIVDIRPHLQAGYLWHTPEVAHTELATADQWWEHMEGILARAFVAAGVKEETARALSKKVRGEYLDMRYWHVYDDVAPALEALAAGGWRHCVVSNHVPELDDIVEGVGLSGYFDAVISSANVGYEKPHPAIYAMAKAKFPEAEEMWMVGDSYEADYVGAERAGMKAILVRKEHAGAERYCEGLGCVVETILGRRE